jgi:hypothetical protein
MRKFSWLLAATIMIMMSVTLVEGQQGKGKGTGGGGFGGFGGIQTPLTLLNAADVKKELDVTDEQLEKLPAEVMVAISKVLNEKQFKRFKQLDLQKKGNRAFKDETIQKQLNMTDEQKKSVGSIVDDSVKELAELRGKGGFGGAGKDNREKIETINKESKEKIYTVLTKEQRKAWRELVGEEFKFATPTFGGFGTDKKGTPKKDAPKKDTE